MTFTLIYDIIYSILRHKDNQSPYRYYSKALKIIIKDIIKVSPKAYLSIHKITKGYALSSTKEIDKPKKGRPKKSTVVSKSKGSRKALGRPKGDAAIINDYKARMLASPKSRKVLDSILSAALDDDHKNQAAAWKLCMDRLLPVSYFEKDRDSGGKSAINISITGVGGETTVISGGAEPIEGEYTDA